jgi:2-dehydropantoate 2-reductase
MRIAIMGSGGLGSFFGAQLARAGEDVTFIARGAQLLALQANGLAVKSPLVGDFRVETRATDTPADVGAVDLVIVGVKTYDLEAAIEQMRPLVGPETLVLPLQNGIDAAEHLARALGEASILVGVAYVASFIESPGVVAHAAMNRILLGERAGGPTQRVEGIAQALRKAGISCETPRDIRIPLWEKLMVLTGTGGVMAMTRLPAGPIRESPEASELFKGALMEAATVARAKNIPLADDVVERHWEMVLELPAGTHGSMLQDLKLGRRLELDALNGAVVRLGRDVGVPTPLNFAVYAALKPFANGAPAMPE